MLNWLRKLLNRDTSSDRANEDSAFDLAEESMDDTYAAPNLASKKPRLNLTKEQLDYLADQIIADHANMEKLNEPMKSAISNLFSALAYETVIVRDRDLGPLRVREVGNRTHCRNKV